MLGQLLNQTVTWWERAGVDGYNKPTFEDPAFVSGRWESGVSISRNTNWQEDVDSAIVYLDFQPSVGDYLYLGESNSTAPTTLDGAAEVKGVRGVPSVHARVTLYVAQLKA